jgi:hypothetical protein
LIYNLLGFLLLSVLALGVTAAASNRSWVPAKLLLLAVVLRIIGSMARYAILFRFYNGLGDAVRYYNEGLDLARGLWGFGTSILSLSYWIPQFGQWWGTLFLVRISGAVLSVIGPTMRGEFLVFSLFSFLGLYAIATAFHNTGLGRTRSLLFAGMIWLWPSLWFWPSSVGKEAVIMLAVGLVTLGYVGKEDTIRWVPFAAGIGLAFCIRPHVAAVLAMAAMGAHWISGWGRLTPRRLLESIAAFILVIVAFNGMRAQFGLADADLEGMVEFVQYRSEQTLEGGSNIGSVPLGPTGIPLAFINVWMRPFPWEAHNMTSAIAAVELAVFWFLVWRQRRGVLFTVRNWRHHRMLRFAVPLLLVYTLMIGLTFGNLGIIARQRAPMFPFMIALLVAAPQWAQGAGRQSAPSRAGARRAA